jgi:biotin carboxyl carrier protein
LYLFKLLKKKDKNILKLPSSLKFAHLLFYFLSFQLSHPMAHYQVTFSNKPPKQVSSQLEFWQVDNQLVNWDLRPIGENKFHLIYKGKNYLAEQVALNKEEKTITLKINGKQVQLSLKSATDLLLDKMGLSNLAGSAVKEVKAPMPGLILSIHVEVGDSVTKGQTLAILEAMKMENVLKSPADGVLSAIKVEKGQSVEKNQVLFQF